MKKTGAVIWGILFVAVGFILAGNALGITDIELFFDGWWTLFIIVPSVMGLLQEREKTGSLIGLCIGVALLLMCQGILDFELIWKLALPVALILIGLSMIFKNVFGRRISEEIDRLNKDRTSGDEYCATFSNQVVDFSGETFRGTTLSAVFGGVKCDLRNAHIEENQVINGTSIFGGIDIYVPDDVKVKIKSTSIFGGVTDKKKHSTDETAKIIYINATCVFGGVEIK